MIIENVKGLGNVHTFEKPFDEALVSLRKNKLISSRDLAYARRITGEDSNLSQNGSYTREAPLYSKDVSLLVLDSPLQNIKLAKKAVQANREGNYFQLEDKELFKKYLNQAEKDLNKEPEKRKVLILPSDENFDISRTENFDFARELFKDQAELYLKFLEESKYEINSIRFYSVSKETVNKSENPIITEMWLCRLVSINWSDLNGYYRILYVNYRVRGVASSRSREATEPRKNFAKLPYNQREIERYSQILENVKTGKLPNSKLEKVLTFFDRLKQ